MNTESIGAQIQKNAYIDKSLQTSREDGSKEQSQKIRTPYRHLDHKNRYGQRQDQKIYNYIFLLDSRTTNVKKKRDKIDNLCGSQKPHVLLKQSLNKKFQ